MSLSFDLAVLGGGISGVGVALEAARRGARVILFEREKLLQATSKNSLRIMHGGLRYLQSLNLYRSFQSTRSQEFLLKKYPEQILPLRCLMPVQHGLKSTVPLTLASLLYGAVRLASGARPIVCSRVLPYSSQADIPPAFAEFFTAGIFEWRDARILNLENFHQILREELIELGVTVKEDTVVSQVTKLVGAGYTVEAAETLGQGEVKHHYVTLAVANALGPWVDGVIHPSNIQLRKPALWAVAINLVFKKSVLGAAALSIPAEQGRQLFFTPRGRGMAIGTWYMVIPTEESLEDVIRTEAEKFLIYLNQQVPALGLNFSDVVDIEQGILPLQSVRGARLSLLGSARISHSDRYVQILSTKYTTFPTQARHVCNLLGF